jgi:hypothetical protein
MTDQDYADLDLAVARVEIAAGRLHVKVGELGLPVIRIDREHWEPFRPSKNAAHAWPIIEEHWPAIVSSLRARQGDGWPHLMGHDAPLLTAFMRAYVATRS